MCFNYLELLIVIKVNIYLYLHCLHDFTNFSGTEFLKYYLFENRISNGINSNDTYSQEIIQMSLFFISVFVLVSNNEIMKYTSIKHRNI